MASGGFLVALWVVAAEACVDQPASLIDLHTSAVATHDVVDTGVNVGSAQNHLTHLLTVSCCDTDWDRQFLGDLGGHTHLVHAQVWVGGNHGAGAKVDTLTRKVASEATLLPLES